MCFDSPNIRREFAELQNLCNFVRMEHTTTFDEVIQEVTPLCIRERNMTLVRKIKQLQEHCERIENQISKLQS